MMMSDPFGKRRTCQVLSYLAVTVLGCMFSVPAQSAPKPAFTFSNEKGLQQAILKNADNLRASYEIMRRASRLQLSPSAAIVYRGLLKQRAEGKPAGNFNIRLQAASAYSIAVADHDLWEERIYNKGTKTSAQQKSWIQRHTGEAYRIIPLCLKAMPQDPTLMLMTARAEFYSSYNIGGERMERERKAIALARKATVVDPKWAASYMVLGRMLNDYNRQHRKAAPVAANAREAVKALEKAKSLDASYAAAAWQQLMYANEGAGQLGKALQAIDAYSRLRPSFGKQAHVTQWRRELVQQLRQKRLQKS
jgi:hypothetical protein